MVLPLWFLPFLAGCHSDLLDIGRLLRNRLWNRLLDVGDEAQALQTDRERERARECPASPLVHQSSILDKQWCVCVAARPNVCLR